MRILHTSDWHIGKKLEGRTRLDEQTAVLQEIVDVCEKEKIQLVIVAGDVFDTFTPSAEAESIFFDAISKLSSGKRIVIIASGNHDDAERLNASHSISTNCDVYFSDSENKLINVNYVESGIKMEKCLNKGGFIVSDGKEKLFVATLSYPTELRLKEKIDDEESYAEKVKRWIKESFAENTNNLPEILVSHLFMLGGMKTDGERNIELGGARIVEKSCIPNECVYTALGHLHKRQIVDKERNILYSGSILQYSFDETGIEKSVTVFDIENGKVQNLKAVELKNGKKLYRFSAKSLEQAEPLISGVDGFIELTLEVDKPLERLEHKNFCTNHPNVFLKLKFTSGVTYASDRRSLSDKELFEEFYMYKFGANPSQELTQRFLEIVESGVCDETVKS